MDSFAVNIQGKSDYSAGSCNSFELPDDSLVHLAAAKRECTIQERNKDSEESSSGNDSVGVDSRPCLSSGIRLIGDLGLTKQIYCHSSNLFHLGCCLYDYYYRTSPFEVVDVTTLARSGVEESRLWSLGSRLDGYFGFAMAGLVAFDTS